MCVDSMDRRGTGRALHMPVCVTLDRPLTALRLSVLSEVTAPTSKAFLKILYLGYFQQVFIPSVLPYIETSGDLTRFNTADAVGAVEVRCWKSGH